MNEQRMIDFETKVLHQEMLLEDLNRVIYRQQQEITQLEIKVAAMLKLFKEAGEAGNNIGPHDVKPPHY